VSAHPPEYAAPETLEDALALLAAHGPEAKVLAGGQSLVPLLNYRLARPRLIVDINGLPLASVHADDGRLRLGALTRHHELEESPEITRRCPLLGEAARLVGNVRVRSLGTLGGSLAHADPAAELPMAMVALDAQVTLASSSGRRTVPAREFFRGYLTTALAPDELLTEIAVPVVFGAGWAIEEFARRPGDFAIVAVAALVSLDHRGRVEEARLAFAGVGDRPVRVPAAEDALRGGEPADERLARAAEIARDGLEPPSDAFVSGAYRRLLAGVLCRRALGRAVTRALGVP
jgi:aerobic carbon-monoxide dehydrogenase medium subunit